jgi:hypothetical protein
VAIKGRQPRHLLLRAMSDVNTSLRNRPSTRGLHGGITPRPSHRQPLAAELGQLLGRLHTRQSIDRGAPFASHAFG